MIRTRLLCFPRRTASSSSCRPLLRISQRCFTTSPRSAFFRSSQWFQQEVLPSTKVSTSGTITPEYTFMKRVGKPKILRQIIFVTIASMSALVLAATETHIETEYWKEKMATLSPIWGVKTITNTDLKRAQNAELIQGLRDSLANLQSWVQQLPVLIRPWINLACVSAMQPYADASEGKRLCWKICLLNAGVWAAWKIKRLQPLMNRAFLSNPLSGLSYTLLTSMFSHKSFLHLLCNCLALESFGSAAYYYFLREQNKAEPDILESTSSYHFLAFFISAGMFSGLVSHIVNAKYRYPRLISQLASSTASTTKAETWAGAVAAASASTAQQATKRNIPEILPSLGASGAIYAAVTTTALAFPDSQVALFIPPTYPINIQYGVGSLMLLDTIGILRGWRLFDHWAHLGGAAFGIVYYNYGPSHWLALRKDIIEAESSP